MQVEHCFRGIWGRTLTVYRALEEGIQIQGIIGWEVGDLLTRLPGPVSTGKLAKAK